MSKRGYRRKRPYRRRRAKNVRRRKVYRSRRRRARMSLVNRAQNPIPRRYFVRLKYHEALQVSGSLIQYRYRVNSIYDPNMTGVGHQPYGHDTLLGMYRQYRVWSCRYTVTIGGGTPAAMLATEISPETLVTLGVDMGTICERPNAKWRLHANNTKTMIRGKCYIPAGLSIPKSQYRTADYATLFGTNPTLPLYLYIWVQHHDASTVVSPSLHVTLTFFTECFDPPLLAQS